MALSADIGKRAAGEAAARLIVSGMRVGLGTGSTAHCFVSALGRRVRDEGLVVTAVATSEATAAQARELGIPVGPLTPAGLDVAVDGADVVDPHLDLVKGRGGALARERIVGAAAARFVIVADDGKLATALHGPVPLEVLEFGAEHTLAAVLELSGHAARLRERHGVPVRSDNGNLLADLDAAELRDAEGLAADLDALPGIVDHGLFLGMADAVLIGHPDGRVEERIAPL